MENRPVYTNSFTITKNAEQNEVVIDLSHNFPIHDVNSDGKVLVVNGRESVFKTVMTIENAKSLRDVLNNVIEN